MSGRGPGAARAVGSEVLGHLCASCRRAVQSCAVLCRAFAVPQPFEAPAFGAGHTDGSVVGTSSVFWF